MGVKLFTLTEASIHGLVLCGLCDQSNVTNQPSSPAVAPGTAVDSREGCLRAGVRMLSSIKNHIVNVLGFVGQKVSMATTQPCYYSGKTATDHM